MEEIFSSEINLYPKNTKINICIQKTVKIPKFLFKELSMERLSILHQ